MSLEIMLLWAGRALYLGFSLITFGSLCWGLVGVIRSEVAKRRVRAGGR